MPILMTYELAMAAGKDAANRNMRKAGRDRWNEEDADLAVDTFNRLCTVEEHFAQIRAGLRDS